MRRFIYVTTQFEGVHRYKDAPDEVSFLRDYHRHIFKVKLAIEVMHNERDIEFIMLKHKLELYLGANYDNLCFEKSCEAIAEDIVGVFGEMYSNRKIKCEVSEDGENGAILESE